MVLSPMTVAAAVLFFGGALLFGGLVFAHGGAARSGQLRVIRELLDGDRGVRARRGAIGSLLALMMGAGLLFAAVASSDVERASRCRSHCEAAGYPAARIGPNTGRDPKDRATWFVACICEGGARTPLEVDANRLLDAR